MKRKGSHEVITYSVGNESLQPGEGNYQRFLTYSPFIRAAYRLNDYLLAYSSFQFTTFKPEFTLTESIESHLEGTNEKIENRYHKRLNSIGVSFGVILEIKGLKKIFEGI